MTWSTRYAILTILFLILAVIGLGACTNGSVQKTEDTQPVTLKIAVLRILDTLPMYVAEDQGYFEDNGVKVEFIPVSSAPERDQMISSGQADGMVNEVVSTLFYNVDEVRVQIVRTARSATSESPLFRILASADSGVTTVEDLKNAEIGISDGTIIEYLTDRLLEGEGYNSDDFPTVSVPAIPTRLELLSNGELKAAMLPDPLSSLAVQNGAVVILDDTSHPELGFSVLSFRKGVIDEHPQAIRSFLAALEQATQDINNNPGKWSELLTEKKLVPPPVMGSYTIPEFPTASVPSEAQYLDAVEWALAKGLIENDVPYNDSVNGNFLP